MSGTNAGERVSLAKDLRRSDLRTPRGEGAIREYERTNSRVRAGSHSGAGCGGFSLRSCWTYSRSVSNASRIELSSFSGKTDINSAVALLQSFARYRRSFSK